MMRELALGSYFPGDSVIHRSDPRTKILLAATFLIAAFAVQGFPALLFLQACLLYPALLAGNRMTLFLRVIRSFLWLSLFTAAVNLFFVRGTPMAEHGFLSHVSLQGIRHGTGMFLRLCILASASSLLTVTTTPLSLSYGLEKLLKPLTPVGMPVHEIAMMIAISFRFIPTILDEAGRIVAAQSSRRPDLAGGSIFRRWVGCVPFIVPLLVGSIRRGNDLAMAMEARCYGVYGARTRMREIEFSRADLVIAGFMIAVLAALIMLEQTNF